jgi:glucose/arabinose dehydrogenase
MLTLLALLAGCGGADAPQVASAQTVSAGVRVPSLPSALVPLQAPASCWAGRGGPPPQQVCLDPVAQGFDRPVWAGAVPGGATWVVEQEGRVRQVGQDALVLDLTDRVSDKSPEEGLLGLAVHPRSPDDPRVFLYWSAAKPRRSVIASFRVTESGLDRDSQQVVLEVAQPYGNHNGGHLVFGPDGFLYVGLGDGGAGGDPKGHGQRTDTLLGSILRLDVDVDPGGATPYAIPPDNPFADGVAGRPEIWAWGLRNPWRFHFDPVTGWLWVGDVGQSKFEEVHIARGGGNHGWNAWEGRHCFNSDTCDETGLVPALWDYGRDLGQSITGGVVYGGRALPELTGAFLAADFASGRLWALCSDGSSLLGEALLADTDTNIAHIGVGATGEPLVVGYDGSLNRLVPRPGSGCP